MLVSGIHFADTGPATFPLEAIRGAISFFMNILVQDIAAHKSVLDIVADIANIIAVTLPLAKVILKVLHRDKDLQKTDKKPEVTITFGDASITVIDEDIKDAEHAAMSIARKLLEEHPEALPCNKLDISGKLADPKP